MLRDRRARPRGSHHLEQDYNELQKRAAETALILIFLGRGSGTGCTSDVDAAMLKSRGGQLQYPASACVHLQVLLNIGRARDLAVKQEHGE